MLKSIKRLVKQFARSSDYWSIGIYTGPSPTHLTNPKKIRNPVLTAKDVTDVPAEFVADPFMVYEDGTWYMFFEVFNTQDDLGDIAFATSLDGFNWSYQRIVLDEPFHLSYPYVFKWEDTYYMIPETYQTNSVRLYKATQFPEQWTFVTSLLEGLDYVDSSIFYTGDRWWMFTSTTQCDTLHLYFSDQLAGPWIEHPQSPVVENNGHIARPGGRVTVTDDCIIRYAQDDDPCYGKNVQAFEVTELTLTTYQEKPVKNTPIIQNSNWGWNKTGMHTIDPHSVGNGQWLACVDGYRVAITLKYKDHLISVGL